MSCNPAIGGLGKGHLVREIDALDGIMARATDRAGIQFRVLNRSKGPAVRGPRAQADRKLYRQAVQALLAEQPGLEIRAGAVEDLVIERRPHRPGVRLATGEILACGAAVLTTGTFLRGLIHIGSETTPAGRVGEAPALGLSATLDRLGFALGRLKTGTPPRLDGRTIDWAALERQPGDDPPEPMSYLTARIEVPQIDCHITATTAASHELIRRNLHLLAHVFRPDREPGPALLPLHRGQGRPLRRQDAPPDLPGARRAGRSDGLSQRHLDLAAAGGPGGPAGHDSRAGAGGHVPAGLCHRI